MTAITGRCIGLAFVCAIFQPLPVPAQVIPLPRYNVDIHNTSVSGLSSGGYMAVQVHVGFSSIMKGIGVIAGGPYNCAQGNLGTALSTCMNGVPAPNPQTYINITLQRESAGDIDPVANLLNQRVYLFSGTLDATVRPVVMNSLHSYYRSFVNHDNIFYKNDLAAAHTMPTDYYGNNCNVSADPFISRCNYDAAGILLRHIYGSLNPRNDGALAGDYLQFDQSEFVPNPTSKGMDTTGWVYVPQSCAAMAPCTLHVVFHGCEQYQVKIGLQFVQNTGYNKWADTNNMVVLYPQTIATSFSPYNPKGCWDWWGYNNPNNYDKKTGAQMQAIKAMIDRLTSAHQPLPPPENLRVAGVTDDTVTLAWESVVGAVGYNVFRDGEQVNATLILPTSYTDMGLRSGTTYAYVVRALADGGGQSGPSNEVIATTTGEPPPIDPPTNVTVSTPTATSLTVSWSAAAGAVGYNIYRSLSSGGPYTRVNSELVNTTSYVDSGLSESTTYYYVVRSVDMVGNESVDSLEANGTTTSGWTCTTTYDNNYNHTVAARAYPYFGYAYAVGSNQFMGLWNIFVYTRLAQTASGYFVVGNCP